MGVDVLGHVGVWVGAGLVDEVVLGKAGGEGRQVEVVDGEEEGVEGQDNGQGRGVEAEVGLTVGVVEVEEGVEDVVVTVVAGEEEEVEAKDSGQENGVLVLSECRCDELLFLEGWGI